MFIISKIITTFFSPFLWIFIFLVLAFKSKSENKRKRLLGIALLSILISSNPLLLNLVQYPLHAPPMPMEQNEKYDLGIVLGGMTRYDPVNQKGYFNMSSDRFIQTALLYKKGHIKKILVCGGQNGFIRYKNFTEAGFVAKNLMDMGIPASDILKEDRSKTTLENAAFAKQIIDSTGVLKGKAVLITSSFHIPRAVETFEAEGIAVRPYPCAFSILPSSIRPGIEDFIPDAAVMSSWSGVMKELIGRAYLFIKASL
jgi:uncharacterized SAM-binding protein YcdF (DUF218 family)